MPFQTYVVIINIIGCEQAIVQGCLRQFVALAQHLPVGSRWTPPARQALPVRQPFCCSPRISVKIMHHEE